MKKLTYLIETLEAAAKGARAEVERVEQSPGASPAEIAAAIGFADGIERAALIARGVGEGSYPTPEFWKGRA